MQSRQASHPYDDGQTCGYYSLNDAMSNGYGVYAASRGSHTVNLTRLAPCGTNPTTLGVGRGDIVVSQGPVGRLLSRNSPPSPGAEAERHRPMRRAIAGPMYDVPRGQWGYAPDRAHQTQQRLQQSPNAADFVEQWRQNIAQDQRLRAIFQPAPALIPGLRAYDRPNETAPAQTSDGLHYRGRDITDLRRAYLEQQMAQGYPLTGPQGNLM
ncbi:hypothetical protein pmac_cds_503 [Pandoravirus macleodensis]|uniref:Uncharacterized protein n=1 Tax=Pandoravirus macleodensis TaxID=2107707 RepID=A0A2U7UGP6_9VIRU|nr:hypothetical protein pmac_cds_503 [Pandoravirus macleodensis]AVK77191.1 hypothetical protein pmac_cds_503 [Pandoravirus macleodensis]UMO79911.1 hypothetical protein [Pandoravirus aubagnensis]